MPVLHQETIVAAKATYELIIGSDLLSQAQKYLQLILPKQTSIMIVYDERLMQYGYEQSLRTALQTTYDHVFMIAVPSGESSKSIEQAMRIYEYSVACGLDRQSAFIALGGGVIGDLTGFVAATYMRGVQFIQVPTTLLAHDSSIGGKVAIDLPSGKNLVGAFHPPALVLYDVHTLSTLPLREISSGLAEAIKHGIIREPSLLTYIKEHAELLLRGDETCLSRLLDQSCRVKAQVVQVDEKEHGLRAILNFGHTIGHAIEIAANERLTHGEAVAIGMVLETDLALHLGLCQSEVRDALVATLTLCQLPTSMHTVMDELPQIASLIELMRHDKKAQNRSLSFVLPTRIGDVTIEKAVDETAVTAILHKEIFA
nr:3-dehydroquinate synthase [Bacilli bacterium]